MTDDQLIELVRAYFSSQKLTEAQISAIEALTGHPMYAGTPLPLQRLADVILKGLAGYRRNTEASKVQQDVSHLATVLELISFAGTKALP